jgi:acetyl esterase/lipase
LKRLCLPILLVPSLLCATALALEAPDDAARFGALEGVSSAALSADGKKLLYVAPAGGSANAAVVIDLAAARAVQVFRADGRPLNVGRCNWAAADRLVCTLSGLVRSNLVLTPVTRTVAMDADGTHPLALGEQDTSRQLYLRQFDGDIVDWMDGTSGAVLMSRYRVPEQTIGTKLASTEEGLGVDRIDTRTGKTSRVEGVSRTATEYLADGRGTVRIMTTAARDNGGRLQGVTRYLYRKVGESDWLPLGANRGDDESVVPIAVDPLINAAYVLQPLDGRDALYRISLDGSLNKELVFASREVDVNDVVRAGRNGRVIGASYVTDRRQVEYFDKEYKAIAASLARALPNLPLLHFVSASADEQILLVWAGSDADAGHFYTFDRGRKSLTEVMLSRPILNGVKMSAVKSLTFPAADGTPIPAYLTLPPGVEDAKNLPSIVLPHGGPAARDEWGFDWLAQYFARQGFAVLQPNFRGSSGYGKTWFATNGFKSWKTAVGDVCDGGRWLVTQGIADPARLGIVGWSYGGYAALQANIVDAKLFKAVVAIAPVTDLAMMKLQARSYDTSRLVADQIGSGDHVEAGSPAQNAASFDAPVLMFHGENDLNVDIAQSRLMDQMLRKEGKSSELVVYPNLEHSLLDSSVRADLLRKADAFLRQHLKLQGEQRDRQ